MNQIISKRLILKEIQEENASCIVKWRSQPEVYKYFLNPKPITIEEHLKWYRESYLKDSNRLDYIAIKDDLPVGVFGIKRDSEESTEVEVSYLLGKNFYGNGYATEAVDALVRYAKENWNSKIVKAIIHKDNNDSIKFAESNNFIFKNADGIFYIYILK